MDKVVRVKVVKKKEKEEKFVMKKRLKALKRLYIILYNQIFIGLRKWDSEIFQDIENTDT